MSISIRTRKLKNGQTSIFLDICFNSKRWCENLNLRLVNSKAEDRTTMQLVKQIKAMRELELVSDKYGITSEFKKNADFISYFQRLVEDKRKDPCWIGTFDKLKKFHNGILQFRHIDMDWLESFKGFLIKELSQNSASVYFAKIKAALNRAVKEKVIKDNPGKYVTNIKRIDTEKSYLEQFEIEALANMKCKYPNVKYAFLLSCQNGMRISDLEKLEWGNINEEKISFRQVKTNQINSIPLSNSAKIILEIIKGNTNICHFKSKVFVLPSRPTINNTIKKWAKDAGIKNKNVSFHSSRHSFATLSLSAGVDIYTVQRLLGHTDIASTQIYAKVTDKSKVEAINKLPQIQFN